MLCDKTFSVESATNLSLLTEKAWFNISAVMIGCRLAILELWLTITKTRKSQKLHPVGNKSELRQINTKCSRTQRIAYIIFIWTANFLVPTLILNHVWQNFCSLSPKQSDVQLPSESRNPLHAYPLLLKNPSLVELKALYDPAGVLEQMRGTS